VATPSEAYYAVGEAIATDFSVDFLTATPKKGRKKALANSMSLTMPTVFVGETVRYGSGISLEMVLIMTASNRHDVLLLMDRVIEWFRTNRNTLNFELLVTGANPYYETSGYSPELVGYEFNVSVNL